jgi:glycosyltransferase involved in cell wall biosynthesis
MSLVSIILTTLNSERFVARSIESCLDQTHTNLEFLIVDGGSLDGTLDVVNSCNDSRIRVIHQQGNEGKLPGAINIGMAHANGDFVTWTQDDCWYERNAIQTMLQYLNDHPRVGLVYADYWDVDESGTRIRYQFVNPPSSILVDDVVRQCFLMRREVYHRIGPQDTQYFPVHEVPWRMRVASCFEIQPLHIPLMYYTLQSNSLTGRYRSAYELQYLAANALLREGYLNAKSYRHRLARIHIDEAFDEFILKGNFSTFKSHAFAGVKLDLRWLSNRGLWKLFIMSLLPARNKFRSNLLRHWTEQDVANQKAIVKKSEEYQEMYIQQKNASQMPLSC